MDKKFTPLRLPSKSITSFGWDTSMVIDDKSWKGQLPDHDRFHQPLLWTADLAVNMAFSIQTLDDFLAARLKVVSGDGTGTLLPTDVPIVLHYPSHPTYAGLPRVILLLVGGYSAWGMNTSTSAYSTALINFLASLRDVFAARADDLNRRGVLVLVWKAFPECVRWSNDVGLYNWLLLGTPARDRTDVVDFDDLDPNYAPVIEPELWLGGDVNYWVILSCDFWAYGSGGNNMSEGNAWTFLYFEGPPTDPSYQLGPVPQSNLIAATGQAYQAALRIYERFSTWVSWWDPRPFGDPPPLAHDYQAACKAHTKLACDACGDTLTYQDFGLWDPPGIVQALTNKLDDYLGPP